MRNGNDYIFNYHIFAGVDFLYHRQQKAQKTYEFINGQNTSFDKVLKFKWDNGFDFKSKLFSEGISDNNKNIEEDIENIIGFLSKKFLSKIIEK